jgi:hypothetical protein
MVQKVEKWVTTGGVVCATKEEADHAELAEEIGALLKQVWHESDANLSLNDIRVIADLITDNVDRFRAVLTGIKVEEGPQFIEVPTPITQLTSPRIVPGREVQEAPVEGCDNQDCRQCYPVNGPQFLSSKRLIPE